MTVADLIAELERCDPDAVVHLATQPAWAMEHLLGPGVAETDGAVFLAEGAFVGYLPGEVAAVVW